VKLTIGKFQKYVARNGIFLTPILKENFENLSKIFWSVLIGKEVGHKANDHQMQIKAFEKLQKEIEPLYKSIEFEIHSRLHPHGI